MACRIELDMGRYYMHAFNVRVEHIGKVVKGNTIE